MDRRSNTPRLLIVTAALALICIACGGGGGDESAKNGSPRTEAVQNESTRSDRGGDTKGDVVDALEANMPEGTIEVPSEQGSTTISDFASGGSDYEPTDAQELAQILAIVGTDADGFLTADSIVVRSSAADATLLCKSADRLGVSSYEVIPVLPDGTGVACQ